MEEGGKSAARTADNTRMGTRPASTDLPPDLLEQMQAIKAKANDYGLDFFEVVFEVLPFEVMNQIAAYGGFPVRYPHWRWGMEYEKLSKRDAYGLGRIYEMVINTDPCYAYLQESNSLTDQKLVMAHVYGHADFFKHNFWFSKTNRKMLDQMANHATRVRRHMDRHGVEAVERFIDACLSVEYLIDPHSLFVQREDRPGGGGPGGAAGAGGAGGLGGADDDDGSDDRGRPGGLGGFSPDRLPAKDYMDPFINPRGEIERQKKAFEAKRSAGARFPARPVRDVLLFLLRHGRLEPWQQDILGIIRDEAYYFVPQAQTKIMNEGWASYWHSHLMTHHFCEASEIVQYADQHSGVVHMPPGGFNPYKIGLELWKDIEERWNTGRHGSAWERLEGVGAKERHDDRSLKGREKIFEVRRIYNDVSFIDEFLTEEFVEKHRMFQTKRDGQSGEVRVASRDFARVKQTLLHHLTNRGEPFIHVVDGNYLNRGELYLAHQWTGLEVDAAKAAETLTNLRMLWGRPVHLQMRMKDDMYLLSCAEAGKDIKRERIGDDTPKPAHAVA